MTTTQSEHLLRRSEVEKRCGLATATIYRKMQEGTFPKPVKVGKRAVRWYESEIVEWLAQCPRVHDEGGHPTTET